MCLALVPLLLAPVMILPLQVTTREVSISHTRIATESWADVQLIAAPSSPAGIPRKKKAKTKQRKEPLAVPCCRCLRSLRSAPGKLFTCESLPGRTRCTRCSGSNRGGSSGCVPVSFLAFFLMNNIH